MGESIHEWCSSVDSSKNGSAILPELPTGWRKRNNSTEKPPLDVLAESQHRGGGTANGGREIG